MHILRSLGHFPGFKNSSRFFASISPGAILALMALSACTTPKSADNIADARGLAAAENNRASYVPVPKTIAVASIQWANAVDSMGVIQVYKNIDPLPAGVILMSRDPQTLKNSAIMQTTDITDKPNGRKQGVMLINGIPSPNDEVIEPGPELKEQVDYNLEQNRRRVDNTTVDNTTNGTGTPNQGIAPGM